ncbi:thioredoxin family protein [Streptococcus danieliae]|uniref:Thiol reductase thioredoxin n=1 Tax=Streptococcus danieliae TaxID=747656 RepID=A0A7Z0M534_9STRE|nr:thioredoxin family protein [Streptococcus danieliae]MBF0698679.1 thiol reductase thioredoxin [Streptococcus danieliae]NYS95856.1 thiol reductase thioredoxin [Streptococcus danieliae]
MDFYQAIANFKPVVTKEVEEILESGQPLILFVGRASCPYSRLFAPKLAQVQAEQGLEVAFLDSENFADWEDLQAFRARYQIVTVPGLLVAEGDRVRVVCDSSLSPEAILDFIQGEG